MAELLCWAIPVGITTIITIATSLAAIYFAIAKSEEQKNQKDKKSKNDYTLEDQKEIT